MDTKEQRPTHDGIGFKVLIAIAILLTILYLMGQTMAIFDYDFAVSIGLQEPIDEITGVGVAMNKGFGFGDTVAYIPLLIMGVWGLIKRTKLGYFCMIGALAITIYWPMVSLPTLFYAKGTDGWRFSDYTSYTILLSLITAYGAWGLWYLFTREKDLLTK